MERAYPYMTHNLLRRDMTPIVVPDQAYDESLCSEWWNPHGVARVGSAPAPVQEPKPRKKRESR